MNIKYQNANNQHGGESYYIKIEDVRQSQTACILVDSGVGVDVEQTLNENEYLAAILVTHAHGDHISSLGKNVTDGAKVYTSPTTAALVEQILDEWYGHNGTNNVNTGGFSGDVTTEQIEQAMNPLQTNGEGLSESVTNDQAKTAIEALAPIEDWTTIVPDIEVCPFQVGHTPGAVGFYLRKTYNSEEKYFVITGDFTFNDVAGNRGMPKQLPVEVDTLFMNASVCQSHQQPLPEILNESLATIFEASLSGGKTVVSVDGLIGIHYAYLMGHIIEQTDREHTITVAGQIGKLYETLDQDIPNAFPTSEFTDPTTVLSGCDICIAGPAVPKPKGRSSTRLFEQIKNSGESTLVQVRSSSTQPIDNAGCTVHDYRYVAHPTQEQIDSLIKDNLRPTQLVVAHGNTDTYGTRYKAVMTFAIDDTDEYELWKKGQRQAPEWIDGERRNEIFNLGDIFEPKIDGDIADVGGDLSPRVTPNFDAEGINEDVIPFQKFTRSPPPQPSTSDKVQPATDQTPPDTDDTVAVGDGSGTVTAESREATSRDPIQREESDVVLQGPVDELVEKITQKTAIRHSQEVEARVIEGGEELVLLQLAEEALPDGTDHGDTVHIRFSNTQPNTD